MRQEGGKGGVDAEEQVDIGREGYGREEEGRRGKGVEESAKKQLKGCWRRRERIWTDEMVKGDIRALSSI
jgi:hypothetical protein